MAEKIIILSFLLVFVLGCVGAGWYGRRLRARTRNGLELRHQQLRVMLTILGIVFLGEIFLAVRSSQTLILNLMLTVGVAVGFGIILFQFLRASQGLRAQPGVSSGRKNATFFWQGAFIILPVAVLAIVSLISLRQDERAAETEARKRAAENVQSLARAMRV